MDAQFPSGTYYRLDVLLQRIILDFIIVQHTIL